MNDKCNDTLSDMDLGEFDYDRESSGSYILDYESEDRHCK